MTHWGEVKAGEWVYLYWQGEVQGPYRVASRANGELFDLAGGWRVANQDAPLLYREGPLILVHTGTATTGPVVYSDLPLEICIIQDEDLAGAAVMPLTRPLDFSTVPVHVASNLRIAQVPQWPGMYGAWEIEAVAPGFRIDPAATEFTFAAGSREAATVLCAELLREQLAFRYCYDEDQGHLFKLSRKTLDYVTRHLERLLPQRGAG